MIKPLQQIKKLGKFFNHNKIYNEIKNTFYALTDQKTTKGVKLNKSVKALEMQILTSNTLDIFIFDAKNNFLVLL